MKLLVATRNAKKSAELRALLEPLGLGLLTPEEVVGLPEVEEDGATFAENAAKKAAECARASGLWTVADDSGLAVDALDGAPGIASARFAGTHGDDAANNAFLLERMANVPDERRGAEFVCAIALAAPDGSIEVAVEGRVRGRILRAPRGTGGFGYDPLFLFEEPGHPASGKTFAELSREEKAEVSHRGRALRALVEELRTKFARSGAQGR